MTDPICLAHSNRARQKPSRACHVNKLVIVFTFAINSSKAWGSFRDLQLYALPPHKICKLVQN